MRVVHGSATWSDEADFAAVATNSAALGFGTSTMRVIVVDAIVIAAQHRQVGRLGMPAVFVRVDVVHLASISRHIAIWLGADEVFGHR